MITVTLTQEEVAERSQALARYANKLADLADEEEGIKADYKQTIADIKKRRLEISGELRRLSRAVRLGVEERSEQQVLFDEEKRMEEFRQEARRQADERIAEGEELIEQRQAEAEQEEVKIHYSDKNPMEKCVCGDYRDEHTKSGGCMIAACDCMEFRPAKVEEGGFQPGFPPGFDPDRASAGLAQADEDDSGTPFPTEFDEVAMKRIASHCIGFDGLNKPVKICQVLGQPHVIVGVDGEEARVINAYPILPLQNVDEDEEARLSCGEDVYVGRRINCGSKKRPNWWVIVGPETIFKLRPAARADDFTATRCDECKRIDGGHTQECSQSNALRFDDYLAYARAHYKSNHQSHARKMELSKLKDDEVRAWKRQQAGNGVETEPAAQLMPTGTLKEVEKKRKNAKGEKLSPVEAAIDR